MLYCIKGDCSRFPFWLGWAGPQCWPPQRKAKHATERSGVAGAAWSGGGQHWFATGGWGIMPLGRSSQHPRPERLIAIGRLGPA